MKLIVKQKKNLKNLSKNLLNKDKAKVFGEILGNIEECIRLLNKIDATYNLMPTFHHLWDEIFYVKEYYIKQTYKVYTKKISKRKYETILKENNRRT